MDRLHTKAKLVTALYQYGTGGEVDMTYSIIVLVALIRQLVHPA
jgi:hypothetical protein